MSYYSTLSEKVKHFFEKFQKLFSGLGIGGIVPDVALHLVVGQLLKTTGRTASDAEKEAIRAAVSRNKLRPTENGCGGSIGVVSRVNVHALNGADVRSILRRVGAGEKITFK